MPHSLAKPLKLPEFVALMAMLSSLMALAIDAMLPALAQIGQELGNQHANDNQLVITSLFMGTALGLLFFGPASDSFGRKPPLFAGLALFIVGCLVSIFAQNFDQMILGRLLQGFGLAAPRVVTLTMVRDQFHGREMARVMSLVMMVFILVPAIAPMLGQTILWFAQWRAIFWFLLAMALVGLLWFALRQPETLARSKRAAFTPIQTGRTIWLVLSNKASMGPTIALGIIFGAILIYLSTAQQIFQGLYHQGDRFALVFGSLALVFGVSSMLNSKLVRRYDMTRLAFVSLTALMGVSGLYYFFAQAWDGVPPFWTLLVYLSFFYFCMAILFGNLNALAMEPLGEVAGIGAAVVGTLSTLISAGLGMVVGQFYNDTVVPLVLGVAFSALVSALVLIWSGKAPFIEAPPTA
ncbi:MAG: multidrug effflux MFS transporter [bacterium]|nr:multidrug effflux MFS transporter [bacterium]